MTIIVALGTISVSQTSETIETEKAVHKLIDYCTTHPDATLRYKASCMIIRAHNDAYYLSESQAMSRSGECFYMGDATDYISRPNGEIMVISTIIRNVMSLAADAECGELFYNSK